MILIKKILIKCKNNLHNKLLLLGLTNHLVIKSLIKNLLNKPHQVLLEVSKFLKTVVLSPQQIKLPAQLQVVLAQKLLVPLSEVFKWIVKTPNPLRPCQTNLYPPQWPNQAQFHLPTSQILYKYLNKYSKM